MWKPVSEQPTTDFPLLTEGTMVSTTELLPQQPLFNGISLGISVGIEMGLTL